jgi:uncharacterized protein YjbK
MERELKFVIASAAAYQLVLERLAPGVEPLVQLNHYMLGDPNGALARGEAMLRLRESGGSFVLAFKSRLSVEGAYFSCQEVEAHIPANEAAALLAGGVDLTASGPPPLRLAAEIDPSPWVRSAGTSCTFRVRAPLPTGDLAELDRSLFPGGIEDFELEVETENPRPVQDLIAELGRSLGLVMPPQTRTKYRRFLDAIRAQGRDGSAPGSQTPS